MRGGIAAGAVLLPSSQAIGAAEKQGDMIAPVARYSVGSIEVNTLLDGAVNVGDPQKTFGMNVDADTFSKA